MSQLTIEKTKDYLVLRIPLKAFKRKKPPISLQEQKAINEGLRALKEGRISKSFRTAKEAVSFLRDL